MSSLVKVKITGIREIQDRMQQMADNLQRRMLVDIMKRALEPTESEAKARAPMNTVEARGAGQKTQGAVGKKLIRSSGPFSQVPGVLKRSFRIKLMRNANPFLLEVQLQNTAYYALWVEYGHRLVRGRGNKARVVGHARARPFMRPTYDSQKEAIINRVVQGIQAGLKRRGL